MPSSSAYLVFLATAMVILLVSRWRAGAQVSEGDLIEALLDLPLDL